MPARIVAGLIALIAWVGLAVQFRATFSTYLTVTASLWAMLLYFTVIANLLVAVAFTAIALGLARAVTPVRLGAVTIAILLVGIVFNLLLRGMVELSGGTNLADFLNHTVTPILVAGFWIFLAEKGRLRWSAPLLWVALPLAYFAYALARASADGNYPYPFMNLAKLGWPQTLLNAVIMALCFVVVGLVMVLFDRRSGDADR